MLAAAGGGGNLGFDGWRNPFQPLDVNGDRLVSALDALVVINLLNRQGPTQLSGPRTTLGGSGRGLAPAGEEPAPFYDVNGDGLVSALDALNVINKLNVANGEQVRIRVEVTDVGGTVIDNIGLGEEFRLNGYVMDLRDNPGFPGVFQAYTDVDYVSALVSVSGPVTFGADYPNGRSVDTSVAGIVDEVGAFDGFTPLGLEERLLFTVPFTADAVGSATFTLNSADGPGHTVLVFGDDTPVPAAEIEFVNAVLLVGSIPSLSIGDVTVSESDGMANFTVSLSAPAPTPITVDFSTAGDSASPGADFEATGGTLTFDVGEMTKIISVPIIDDMVDEPSESFFLNLSNASGANITDGLAVGTILDDDVTPEISIADVTQREGRTAPVNAVFEVTLSAPSGLPVTVNFATADGTAAAGSDYVAASGTLAFAPGQTSRTITVSILPDMVEEPDETFTVNLAGAVNAVIVDGEGTGTVLDAFGDIVRIRLETFDAVGVSEDQFDIGDTVLLRAFVEDQRSPAEGVFQAFLDVFFEESVVSLGTPIMFGADYPNNRRFNAGTPGLIDEIGATDGFTPLGPGERLLFEAPFTAIANGGFQFLADPADGVSSRVLVFGDETTISPDDVDYVSTSIQVGGPPTLSIDDVTAIEGNPAQFTVSLSHGGLGTVTVDFATANGTATAGADYTANSDTLTFPPGVLTQTVTVDVLTDALVEPDETFEVNLSNSSGAAIADGQGVATILATPPVLAINSVSVVEGNSGTTNAVFTVTLSDVSARPVTVDFATGGGTATANVDYQPTAGTLTFAPGETVQTIQVPVIGDLVDEVNETFAVTLTGAVNATIGVNRGVGTIIDDELTPSSIAGFVYLDSNNNGVKDAGEDGIEGVHITLNGTALGAPVMRETTTGPDGSYLFGNLIPGEYTIAETQPGFFVDGADTPGNVGGAAGNDLLTLLLPEETAAANYNFGELGLRSPFLSRRLFLSSTPTDGEISGLNLEAGDLWFSFDTGFSTLSARAVSNTGRPVVLTLYDKDVNPLITVGPGAFAQLDFLAGVLGQAFFLRVGGGSDSVTLNLLTSNDPPPGGGTGVDTVIADDDFLASLRR